jgi:hypothetical protein
LRDWQTRDRRVLGDQEIVHVLLICPPALEDRDELQRSYSR